MTNLFHECECHLLSYLTQSVQTARTAHAVRGCHTVTNLFQLSSRSVDNVQLLADGFRQTLGQALFVQQGLHSRASPSLQNLLPPLQLQPSPVDLQLCTSNTKTLGKLLCTGIHAGLACAVHSEKQCQCPAYCMPCQASSCNPVQLIFSSAQATYELLASCFTQTHKIY